MISRLLLYEQTKRSDRRLFHYNFLVFFNEIKNCMSHNEYTLGLLCHSAFKNKRNLVMLDWYVFIEWYTNTSGPISYNCFSYLCIWIIKFWKLHITISLLPEIFVLNPPSILHASESLLSKFQILNFPLKSTPYYNPNHFTRVGKWGI